ncbi:DNA repair protein RecN [Caldanaerobacter subterraneus KAk]|uniref:DNA repair protein RecN n=1 Tax=Caldanaerobacter subterraneus TaxID=911092 RepID=UPI0032BF8177
MLLNLSIQNVAIIDKLEVEFKEGFNVLTGETGAGKSIVIDSVLLLIGARANKDIIRSGEERALVEGVFLVDSNKDKIAELLEEAGVSQEEDDTLIISREITKSGRSYSRVNGKIVPLSFLDKIGALLVDILGQHEHQFLLDSSQHLFILDNFGDEEFKALKERFKQLLEEYRSVVKEKTSLFKDEREKEQMIDLLRYQIQEIESANLSEEEEQQLIERRNILMNYEKLFNAVNSSYKILYEGNGGFSVLDNLHKVVKNLETAFSIDGKLKGLKEKLENILYETEDAALQLRDYLGAIDFNQKALEEIEERLNHINFLKRKYGPTISHILSFKEEKEKELNKILHFEERQKELEEKEAKLWEEINKMGSKIHEKRKTLASHIEEEINKVLKELNMPNASFKVDITKEESPNENGFDRVEFLISTNIGEPLKPLSKIASGGELSRIMLALKTILASSDGIPTLIFDEVDTGISGKTAQLVAEKMAYLSRRHQLICVTHLPQIACMADAHYFISKISKGDRTYIKLTELDYEGRIKELARIMGGEKITSTILEHAKELLEMASKFKNSL